MQTLIVQCKAFYFDNLQGCLHKILEIQLKKYIKYVTINHTYKEWGGDF